VSNTLLVADAGPPIAYASINRLDLLNQLFGTILIPAVVRDEISPSLPLPPAWIQADDRGLNDVLRRVPPRLDPGERNAIALALATETERLLIDDRSGRKVAIALNLQVIGSFGVAALARRRGVIPKAQPLLDALIRTGFYVSPEIHVAALEAAGDEVPDQLPFPDNPR
jgi:predicted nucleic acid-binding protein